MEIGGEERVDAVDFISQTYYMIEGFLVLAGV